MENINLKRFCVDPWEDPDREDVDADSEYYGTLEKAEARIRVLWAGGRFKWINLSRQISGSGDDDWELIETYNKDNPPSPPNKI
jgi:hypothetical protein